MLGLDGGEETGGRLTKSGGKRWECKEVQESHKEGSICSPKKHRAGFYDMLNAKLSYFEVKYLKIYLECYHSHHCTKSPHQTFVKWNNKNNTQVIQKANRAKNVPF